MLIYLQGSSSFLARQAMVELKKRYLAKNPDSAELIEIDADSPPSSWADLQALPLFATTRLVLVKGAGRFLKNVQQALATALVNLPETTVVVVWDELTPKEPQLVDTLKEAKKVINAEAPQGAALKKWVINHASTLSIVLTADQAQALIDRFSTDLWAIHTELMTSQHQSADRTSTWQRLAADKPFAVYDLLRGKKWTQLGSYLMRTAERGEPIEMTLGSLAAAVRKVLQDQAERRRLIDLLADIDIALKSGLIESHDALVLLVVHLPREYDKRVQWGEAWEHLT